MALNRSDGHFAGGRGRGEVELDGGLGIVLNVAQFHFLEFPAAFDLGEIVRRKFLQELVAGVVGLGDDDAAVLAVNPRAHAHVGAGGGSRVGALQDQATATAAHLSPHDALAGPVQEFQTQVGDPEIRPGERDHGGVAGGVVGARAVGSGADQCAAARRETAKPAVPITKAAIRICGARLCRPDQPERGGYAKALGNLATCSGWSMTTQPRSRSEWAGQPPRGAGQDR